MTVILLSGVMRSQALGAKVLLVLGTSASARLAAKPETTGRVKPTTRAALPGS